MRPWSTRTLNAVVVAAGFATAGTGSAVAAEGTGPEMPDLSQVPDRIEFTAPLDTCQNPGGVVPGREKAPCADVTLQVSSQNMVKEVGRDIVTTAHGVAGELRDDEPVLAPGEPNRLLGHVTAEVNRIERMADYRPEVGAKVEPGYTGLLNERGERTTLVDAKVGPLQPDHQGFSALDTSVDATVAQGYAVEPMTSPVGDVADVAEQNPLRTSGAPVTPPRAGEVVPALKQVPAMAGLDHGLVDVVRETGQDLLVQPLGSSAGDRPGKHAAGQPGQTLPVGQLTGTLPVSDLT